MGAAAPVLKGKIFIKGAERMLPHTPGIKIVCYSGLQRTGQ